jgi:hypothetical protein
MLVGGSRSNRSSQLGRTRFSEIPDGDVLETVMQTTLTFILQSPQPLGHRQSTLKDISRPLTIWQEQYSNTPRDIMAALDPSSNRLHIKDNAQPSSSSSSARPTPPTVLQATEDDSSISLHLPERLLVLPPAAFALGAFVGLSRGGSRARLRFLAENAHRPPTTVQGWVSVGRRF